MSEKKLKRLEWSPRASEDYFEAWRYIVEHHSLRNADLVVSRIMKAALSLAHFPLLGKSGQIPGTRELVVPRAPFVIVYRVMAGSLRIERVLPDAMDRA